MTDFFGGILDELQGYANDVSGFFDTSLKQAGAKAWQGGMTNYNQVANAKDRMMSVDHSDATAGKTKAIESESYDTAEAKWLQRMKTFANLDTGTSVKLGK